MTETEIQIKYIEGQIEQAKAYSAYWIGMAVSGAAGRRIITRGDNHRLTADELVDDAMKTALRHIERIEELNDYRDKLLRDHAKNQSNVPIKDQRPGSHNLGT